MEYQVGNGFFIKTLLAKKYALPTQVINALVNFFIKFAEEGLDDYDEEDSEQDVAASGMGMNGEERMPVMWHQTLLTLVQCYRPYLTVANCLKLKALIKVHFHNSISPEIRKCLAADYLKNSAAQP